MLYVNAIMIEHATVWTKMFGRQKLNTTT